MTTNRFILTLLVTHACLAALGVAAGQAPNDKSTAATDTLPIEQPTEANTLPTQQHAHAEATETETVDVEVYPAYGHYRHKDCPGGDCNAGNMWNSLFPSNRYGGSTCTCGCPLSPTRLDGQNGCVNGCTSGAGGLCTEADPTIPTAGGPCRTCLTAWTSSWAYCRGAAAALCYQVTCPRGGFVMIQGQAASGLTGGCTGCNPLNYLFLYRGAFNSGTLLVDNQRVVNWQGYCSSGEVFTLCERQGIFMTNTLNFRFYGTYDNGCPQGCNALGCSP